VSGSRRSCNNTETEMGQVEDGPSVYGQIRQNGNRSVQSDERRRSQSCRIKIRLERESVRSTRRSGSGSIRSETQAGSRCPFLASPFGMKSSTTIFYLANLDKISTQIYRKKSHSKILAFQGLKNCKAIFMSLYLNDPDFDLAVNYDQNGLLKANPKAT
jgi:hypothetical protein